jgi:hypothetical protein
MDNAQLYYEVTAQMARLEERMEAQLYDVLDRMLADDELDLQEPVSLVYAIAQLAVAGHLFPRLRERFQEEEVQDFLVRIMRDFLLKSDQ